MSKLTDEDYPSGVAVDRGAITEIRAHCVEDWETWINAIPAFGGRTPDHLVLNLGGESLTLDRSRTRLFASALTEWANA